MNRRLPRRWLIALPALLLAGCGAAQASDSAGTVKGAQPTMSAEMQGMNMHGDMPGMNMPSADSGTPSATSQMVCSAEIRRDVATLLSLPALPHVVPSWRDHRYTCTYHLPVGALDISVTEASSKTAAVSYFDALRTARAGKTLTGVASFGLPGFSAADGTVAFVKDTSMLVVDPTGLPNKVGRSTRSEFAYTVASDILGCWNGD